MAKEQQPTVLPASDPAPVLAPQPEKGPGVLALEALLREGVPEPKKVVAVLDAHRGERDSIFALLHQSLGNDYVQSVVAETDRLRASIDRAEVVSGDPSNPEGGYFLASREERGARWRSGDGDFTGTIGKEGLDSRYRLDEDDALHAHIGKDRTGTLGWERDGKTQAELYGRYRSGSEYEAGIRRPWELSGGGTLTTGLTHRVADGRATDGISGAYRSADGKTTYDGLLGMQDGGFAGSAGFSHALNPRDTIAGSIAHDPTGTSLTGSATRRLDDGSLSGTASVHHGPDGTTGSIAGAYRSRDTRIDGSYTHALDSDKLHLGASHDLSPRMTVGGQLDHEITGTGSQTTLALSERYRSSELSHRLSLDAGKGERDYLGVSGSTDVRLAPSLYAGGFGSYRIEDGKQSTGQLGASLTFTPQEKSALSLIGVLDQDGGLETRLQLDIFKKRITGADFLADHKKDALVSLFVSYSTGGTGGRLDDRFGSSQLGTSQPAGDGQVMGGIRIRF